MESLINAGALQHTSAQGLRATVVQYIREHPQVFADNVRHDCNETVRQYCGRMSRDGTDGDYVFLCAAALLFDWRVFVHFTGTRRFLVENDNPGSVSRDVHLRWTPGHYSVLTR